MISFLLLEMAQCISSAALGETFNFAWIYWHHKNAITIHKSSSISDAA